MDIFIKAQHDMYQHINEQIYLTVCIDVCNVLTKKGRVNDEMSYLLTEIQKNGSGNLLVITPAVRPIYKC